MCSCTVQALSAAAEAQRAQTFSGVRHGNVLGHIAERRLLRVAQPHWIVGVGRLQQEFDCIEKYWSIEKVAEQKYLFSSCVNGFQMLAQQCSALISIEYVDFSIMRKYFVEILQYIFFYFLSFRSTVLHFSPLTLGTERLPIMIVFCHDYVMIIDFKTWCTGPKALC